MTPVEIRVTGRWTRRNCRQQWPGDVCDAVGTLQRIWHASAARLSRDGYSLAGLPGPLRCLQALCVTSVHWLVMMLGRSQQGGVAGAGHQVVAWGSESELCTDALRPESCVVSRILRSSIAV